jgi:energy-coupling factor transporter ATP-binding protein EcfA2
VALADVDSLTFTYPGASAPALLDVSLELDEGEIVALLGPSGSGKSTLLRALAGLAPHFHGGRFAGRLEVCGRDTRGTRPADLAGQVASVFQDPEDQIVMAFVANEVAFGLENLGVEPPSIWPRVDAALERVDATHLRDRRTTELSGGELQRVCLASALALEPELLLLDEPTSQLDPAAAELFLDEVERLGQTVVLSEQRVDRALRLATRVLYMEGGRILCDALREEGEAWLRANRPRYAPSGPSWAREEPCDTVSRSRTRAEIVSSGGYPPTFLQAPAGPEGLSDTASLSQEARPVGEAVVALRGISYAHRPGVPVLEGLDLVVHRGEIVALQGANGSGKTTLAKLAAGLLQPEDGSVTRAGRAGYLLQDPGRYVVCETALEEAALAVAGDSRRARIELERVGLTHLADRHPRDLSSGERERLGVAAVAVAEPDLLVLDEPTRGLDPDRKIVLYDWLVDYATSGRAVLVATHDQELPADRCVSLAEQEEGLLVA